MHVFFSADDRQEYLDLLSQSASKHAFDFLASRGSGPAAARAYQRQPGKYDQLAAKVHGWFGDTGACKWTEDKIENPD